MSTHSDAAMQLTMSANISDAGEFAESVTYVKKPDAGVSVSRSIYAVITRDPPQDVGDGRAKTISAIFLVQNDVTAGIALSELATGDQITYYARRGVAATAKTVQVSLATDRGDPGNAGTIRLEA